MKKNILFVFCIFLGFVFINSNFLNIKNINNEKNEYMIMNEEETMNASEFVNYINDPENVDENNTINIYQDVDLSNFSNAEVNYDPNSNIGNPYSIHDKDTLNINFNGHTIKNKTLISKDVSSRHENSITQELYDSNKENSEELYSKNVSYIYSYYYEYLFYGIENLTIENAIFENSPLIGYDITNLTLNNVIFQNINFSNQYFVEYTFSDSILLVDSESYDKPLERNLGILFDQIDNLEINNVLIDNVLVSQNIFNYRFQSKAPSSPSKTSIGLFTRIGKDENSIININNLSMQNINIEQNDRGVYLNVDSLLSYGLFNGVQGKLNMDQIYISNISFLYNNLSNYENITSLFILDNKFNYENFNANNVFIGNVFSNQYFDNSPYETNNTSIFDTGFYVEAPTSITGNGNNNWIKIDNSNLKQLNFSNVDVINYTEEEKQELLYLNNYSSDIKINTFDGGVINNVNYIDSNIAYSKDYFDSNFDSNYYLYQENQYPQPIIKPIILSSAKNDWDEITINTDVKTGFSVYNSEDNYYQINLYENGNLVSDNYNPIPLSENYEFKYNKGSNHRGNYSYEIVLNYEGEQILVVPNTMIPISNYPLWIPLTISLIIIILIILLILLIFYIIWKQNKLIAESSSHINDIVIREEVVYSPEQIANSFKILELEENTTLKKVEKKYYQSIKKLENKMINNEQFMEIHNAYVMVSQYIFNGGNS